MSLLDDVKDAIAVALDRKPNIIGAGTSSLEIDVRFFDDGAVKNISLKPKMEFTVRSRRAPIDQYHFTTGSEESLAGGLTSTV